MFSSLSTSYRQLLMSSSLKQQNWRKTEVKTDTAIYCLVSFKLLLLSSFLLSGMPLKLCFTKLMRILQKENKTTMISIVLSVLFSQNFKCWSRYLQKMEKFGFTIKSWTENKTSLKTCISLLVIYVKLKLLLKLYFQNKIDNIYWWIVL